MAGMTAGLRKALEQVYVFTDEVLFQPKVPGEHVRDEPVRQGALLAQEPDHLSLRHDADSTGHQRRGGREAKRLTGQRTFAEELADVEHSHNGFLAYPRQHGELTRPRTMSNTASDASPCVRMYSPRWTGNGSRPPHAPAADASCLAKNCSEPRRSRSPRRGRHEQPLRDGGIPQSRVKRHDRGRFRIECRRHVKGVKSAQRNCRRQLQPFRRADGSVASVPPDTTTPAASKPHDKAAAPHPG